MFRNQQQFVRLGGLFLFALTLNLAGTWILPLVDRDETWYAEVSREMNERGDHIVPYFNNQLFLTKPPLLYWCQSAAYEIFGSNEFGARFPATLASALTVLVIFGFCARLYNRQIAWRAALAFTLCFEMAIFGKAGLTDMPAVLFVTLAAWAGWELTGAATASPVSKTGWWWTFYFSLAAIFLAKGPLAVLPVGGLLVFWRWARVPDFFRVMKFGRGFVVSGALVALWFVPAVIDTQGQFFQVFIGREVLAKSVNAQEGHGASNVLTYLVTLPYYFVFVLPLFFPWSVYFPGAIRRFKLERSTADIYLVSGILVTFVLFTLFRTKVPTYTLPAFPLIACVVAPVLSGVRFVRWALVMVVFNLAVSFVVFPVAARYSAATRLANDPAVRDGMGFASVDYNEPDLIWNFRKHLKAWNVMIKATDVGTYMKQDGARLCVLPSSYMRQITVDPQWKIVNARGFNIAKGRMVELSMLVKSK